MVSDDTGKAADAPARLDDSARPVTAAESPSEQALRRELYERNAAMEAARRGYGAGSGQISEQVMAGSDPGEPTAAQNTVVTTTNSDKAEEPRVDGDSDRPAQGTAAAAGPTSDAPARIDNAGQAFTALEAGNESVASVAQPAAPVIAAPASPEEPRRPGAETESDAVKAEKRRMSKAPPSSIEAAVAEISKRQRALDDSAGSQTGAAERSEDASDRRARMSAERREAAQPRAESSRFDRRLEEIADRIERAADLAGSNKRLDISIATPIGFEGLQSEIAKLALRLEETRPPDSHPDLQMLRREVADMSQALAELAPRGTVASLEKTVRELSARIQESRENGVGASVLAPAEHIALDLRQALKDFDPRETMDALDHEIKLVRDKLDEMAQRGFDPAAFARIHDQTKEIRDILTAASQRPMPVEKMEQQIAALHSRLDEIAAQNAAPPQVSDPEASPKAFAALTKRAADPFASLASPLSSLESRLDALARKIDDSLANPATQQSLDALTRKIDESLSSRPASQDSVDALRTRIDASLAAPGTQESLESLTRGVERIQETLTHQLADVADTRPLESLVQQLSESVERIQSPENAAGLEAIERQIAGIAAMLSDAAQAAPHVEKISRDLVDLRAMQGEADQRAQATLLGVQSAIERVLDRLSHLDDDRIAALKGAAMDRPLPAAPAAKREEADGAADVAPLQAPRPLTPAVPDLVATRSREPVEAAAFPPAAKTEIAGPRDLDVAEAARRETSETHDLDVAAAASKDNAIDLPDARPAEDFLIEPGSGFAPKRPEGAPRLWPNAAVQAEAAKDDEDEPSPQSSFIAAARRATQAAAAESGTLALRTQLVAKEPGSRDAKIAASSGRAAFARTFGRERLRPILIGALGLVVLLGAYVAMRGAIGPQVVSPGKPDVTEPEVTAPNAPASSAPAPATSPATPHAEEDTAPQKTETSAATAAPAAAAADATATEPTPAKPETALATPPATPPQAASAAAAGPGVDASSVGSIDASASPPASSGSSQVPAAGTTASLPSLAALPPEQPPVPSGQPLREAAAAGNAAAQYELGARLAEGRLMARDPKGAVEWFGRAAAQGMIPAEYRLGVDYEKGIGVAQNLQLARAWYQRAAESGNAHAMHNLAVVIAEGAGGKPDYAEAASWFRKAAEYGIRDSQFNLGILFARGLGMPQDLSQSYVWFAIAAGQGDEDAARKRDEVAKRLDAKNLETVKSTVEAFRSKPLDKTANEPPRPLEAWDAPAKPDPKTPGAPRPKMSTL